jgi:hypothetical protein
MLAETSDCILRKKLIAEEPTMVSFFDVLRDGLEGHPSYETAKAPLSPRQVGLQINGDESATAPNPLLEFFDSAPGQIDILRTSLSEISRSSDRAGHLVALSEFSRQVPG